MKTALPRSRGKIAGRSLTLAVLKEIRKGAARAAIFSRLLTFAVSIMTLSALDSGQEWFGFTPYPGARQLCNQSVMEQHSTVAMEIHWRSYATTDAMSKVVAFYQKVKDVEKGSDSVTFRLDKDTTLSVQAATSSDYPKCESKARSSDQTVIVVSHAARR